MSQSTAVRVARPAARPTPRAAGRAGGPRLRVVAAPANTRSRAGLTIGCLVLLAVGLVGLLLLNVSLEKGAFVRRHQQSEIEKLQERRQALLEELARFEAPQALAGRAAALGMVEAPNAAFIRVQDGRVLGEPLPGVASKSPNVTAPGAPASGRGAGAGPAASATPGKGTAAGTAQTSTKVTGAGTASATTTATSGTPTGQKAGAGSAAPAGAKPSAGAAAKPAAEPTTKPTTRRATTATATP